MAAGKKTEADRKYPLASSSELAALLGLDERSVQLLAREGNIPCVSRRPYRFDLLEAIPPYVRHLSEKARGRGGKSAEALSDEQRKARADADLKEYKAQVARMEMEELEGRLHRSEDVEAMTTDLVYAVRAALVAMPGRLAMDMAKVGTANEASERIRAECRLILEDLSRYRYDPEAYRKRVAERSGMDGDVEDEDGHAD